MWMVQRGDGACLAFEARTQIGITSDFAWQDLDRDGAIEARVAGFIHLAHATGAERADDFIRAEAGAGGDATRA